MLTRLNFLTLASIQTGIYICGSAIMGGYLLYAMEGLKGAITSLIVGSFILWGIAMIFSHLAVTGRKVLIEIVQDYFGKGGAQVCGLAFAISLIGWFAIQLELVVTGIHSIYPFLPLLPLKVILGLLMTANVVKGIGLISKFADASVPFLIGLMGYVMWLIYDPSHPFPESQWTFSLKGVSLVVALSMTGAIDAPTYFCLSRSTKDAYIAISIVYLLVMPFMVIVGLALGFYTGAENFIAAIMGLGGKTWQFLVMLFIILAGWTTNNGNLYSASKALGPCIPMGFAQRTWLIGILGSGVACLGVLEKLTNALSAMGIVIAALGAALLGCCLKNRIRYMPPLSTEHKYYLCFIWLGIVVGVLSQFKWITFFNYSFIDSFVITLCLVFMYEGINYFRRISLVK